MYEFCQKNLFDILKTGTIFLNFDRFEQIVTTDARKPKINIKPMINVTKF